MFFYLCISCHATKIFLFHFLILLIKLQIISSIYKVCNTFRACPCSSKVTQRQQHWNNEHWGLTDLQDLDERLGSLQVNCRQPSRHLGPNGRRKDLGIRTEQFVWERGRPLATSKHWAPCYKHF